MKKLLVPFLLLIISACSSTPDAPPVDTAADAGEAVVKPEPAEKAPAPKFRATPEHSVFELLVAEFALRRRQYGLALDNYLTQANVTRDVNLAASAARLAQYLNAEQQSLAGAQLWLELEPGNTEAMSIAASALARSARPMDALDYMVQVLEQGGNANFTALAASALTLSSDTQRAFMGRLETLEQRFPGESTLKTARALLLQYNNGQEQALALVRQVLAQEPADIHALLIETQVLQQLGRNEEAIARLGFAVQEFPRNRRLRLQLARLLTRQDLPAAQRHYQVLRNQYPDDADIALALALVLRENGEDEAAKKELKLLLQSDSHRNRAHYFLASMAERDKDWDTALQHYRQITPGEEFRVALSRIANINRQQNGLEQAVAALLQLRQRFPDQDVTVTLALSDMLLQQRDYHQGHALLTEALARHPKETRLLYARSLFSERLRNVDLLEKDLRTILSSEPDNAAALNALGYSLAILTDRLEEARTLVEKALEQRPEDPAIQDSYGWIAYRQGDLELALTYLERAFAGARDHEIAAHLGEVYWVLGRHEKAIKTWQQGLESEPDSPIISETMDRLNVHHAPTE